MKRPREEGFAMLAALLVAVVAALFAGVAVAAALGTIDVTASDASRARARAAAEAGIELGLHRVCWMLARPDSALRCEVASGAPDDDADDAEVTLEAVQPISLGWPLSARLVRVAGAASSGGATARAVSLVLMQPTALPRGVSVAEDADAQASVCVGGCGMYVGGSVRGREHVALGASEEPALPTDPAPDFAWGGRWPAAGVHAGGGIWAAGTEILGLDPLPLAYAQDTVSTDVRALVELPDAAWLASARAHALDPADALFDGVLRLDRLPPALPTGEPGSGEVAGCGDPSAGYLVYVSSGGIDGGVSLVGRRDPLWAPVTVVVEGDGILGGASASSSAGDEDAPAVAFRGALVVTGQLEVAATSSITGHVACRRLHVDAPLEVTLAAGWRERPPVGSLEPFLVARE